MSTDFSRGLAFDQRPLVVVALGGNALSPPRASSKADDEAADYATERAIVARTAATMDRLIGAGNRLLIVHGNGPQVGRLLRSDPGHGNLDIHVAQTQGELGYLLIAACRAGPMVGLLTRVVVTEALGAPVKPIGPVLRSAPPGESAVAIAGGWRVTVPSPKPARVLESAAIGGLLRAHHVVAGGGGGVPVDEQGRPLNCVIDKDWVASLLAIDLDADGLVFATDVDGVYRDDRAKAAPPLERLDAVEARALIADGTVRPGSMAPKLGSAVAYAVATGRSATICSLEAIADAVAGVPKVGTVVSS